MWGNRGQRNDRRQQREGQADHSAGCEYLEDERPADAEEDHADSLGWRAARHSRPEDWPARPERP